MGTSDNNIAQGVLNEGNSKFLKVFYTNADCLSQSKKDELENYIQNISPDIIGITEIFPKRSSFINQEIFYHLENYDMFFSNINEGCGVAI